MYFLLVSVILFIQICTAAVTITPDTNIRPQSLFYQLETYLPVAAETHELIIVPTTNMLLISQMSNSVLLKAEMDGAVVKQLAAFQIDQPTSGLHGLTNSKANPGKVWATLETANKLLLLDPAVTTVAGTPTVVQEIDIPSPGKGPHYVGEYGDDLWVTLRESRHVLRISHKNSTNFDLFQALPVPIFVAQHPVNNMFYNSQDNSNKIMKIDPTTKTTTQIDIPTNEGEKPVGMISGPQGVWFTLLGNTTAGPGTFGRINADDQLQFFHLKRDLGANAALLHLTFGDDPNTNQIVLLASSIINPNAIDMMIVVTFDATWSNITYEQYTALPTQKCKAHRILKTGKYYMATELTASTLFTAYQAA
ncbi:uncharacterized protein BX664DRAFT_342910 [Halteromyces radiatus]|uniref:uncharacterized protein n=1 Tax=Halteromyces radiatus TaxID=101107 RepID=UPI00221F6E4D|nr:uncharacterized protein BX664DRAFT_342910 [Halteromyces radiatus]KAI8078866.1 hypothetical protein BX664DRAFT_342910 [Halteromyces radiatus]